MENNRHLLKGNPQNTTAHTGIDLSNRGVAFYNKLILSCLRLVCCYPRKTVSIERCSDEFLTTPKQVE